MSLLRLDLRFNNFINFQEIVFLIDYLVVVFIDDEVNLQKLIVNQ